MPLHHIPTLYRWERRGIVAPLRDYRGWRFHRSGLSAIERGESLMLFLNCIVELGEVLGAGMYALVMPATVELAKDREPMGALEQRVIAAMDAWIREHSIVTINEPGEAWGGRISPPVRLPTLDELAGLLDMAVPLSFEDGRDLIEAMTRTGITRGWEVRSGDHR